MVFTHENARGASVFDVEARETLARVLSVDTAEGLITVCPDPKRLTMAGDEIETSTRRYRAIHPIYAGRKSPLLFHCYGRLA